VVPDGINPLIKQQKYYRGEAVRDALPLPNLENKSCHSLTTGSE